jgi:ribosomal protein S18 acetylase RimI-like enzyme
LSPALVPGLDAALLRRIEDASLNASAPAQQLWIDGWLVRLAPGKARRSRSIQAVAEGHRSIDDKLAECTALYREATLPLQLRLTPFSQPAGLAARLDALGWAAIDPTLVLVCTQLPTAQEPRPPHGLHAIAADARRYAQAVGVLRGSSARDIAGHAGRLAQSPVPYAGRLWCDDAGEVLACGQFARQGDLVGLYDIFTAPAARGRGLARALCTQLLTQAAAEGARSAYLQVDAGNAPALAVYRSLGFAAAYDYVYRSPDPAAR